MPNVGSDPDPERGRTVNEPPRSKLRGISRLIAALQTKQASGNMTRRDLNGSQSGCAHLHDTLYVEYTSVEPRVLGSTHEDGRRKLIPHLHGS